MTMRFITWDVEHGSAAYIKTPNGKHIAVDLGARRATDAGFRPLAYLRQNYGVTQLDAVIITHPHLDHIEDIMNFDGLSPKSFRRPSQLTENEIWGSNKKASQETRQIIQKYIEIDKRYNQPSTAETDLLNQSNFGGVHFQLFTPVTPPRTNINNPQHSNRDDLPRSEIPHARRQRTTLLGRTSRKTRICDSHQRNPRTHRPAPRKRIWVPRPPLQNNQPPADHHLRRKVCRHKRHKQIFRPNQGLESIQKKRISS